MSSTSSHNPPAPAVATESVESVAFSFLSDEEVRKHSVVKITSPRLLDVVERPVPGGLYDPLLGLLNDKTICKTCGQRSTICPGHCGHVDLISPVYNPLLFNFLYKLLQRICFFRHHFRVDRKQVEKCVNQLDLIIKGDIVGAKRLGSDLDSLGDVEYNDGDIPGSQESRSMIHSDAMCYNVEHLKRQEWTCLQFTEAMNVFNNFLKPKIKKCKTCKAANPNITKPTFGWFHMSGMSGAEIRANVIRGRQLGGPFTDELEGITDVEDAAVPPGDTQTTRKRCTKNAGHVCAEFTKQKNTLSRQLLPSEVKDILELFWENEDKLCSFISDIQQQGLRRKNTGSFMFFLETILVPPIKFRPPTKGGDSVS